MSRARGRLCLLAVLALASLGGSCGGGDGSGGNGAGIRINVAAAPLQNSDARCAPLPESFPPGFSFVPGLSGRVVAASLGNTQVLVPFDVDSAPPEIPAGVPILGIPLDSDGDGNTEPGPTTSRAPILDDVFAIDAELGLATASGYEEVIVFRPDTSTLATVEIEVPASVPVDDYRFLPDPGTSAVRTAVSTSACVRPPGSPPRDSRGDPLATSPRACDPTVPSFRTGFTSGATILADALFVSTSNLVSGGGSRDPRFLPGTVLVYDFDRLEDPPLVSPDVDQPAIFTSAFNPTHVTPYRVGGREFVLVTSSGSIGITEDDPGTTALESAGVALTPAAIDVIDAQTRVHVATIPLGLAALAFSGPAIDPSGQVAAIGSIAGRDLLVVDLRPLVDLPSAPAVPEVRDDLVVYGADAPFTLPALPGGAPPESCPGQLFGTAFDALGELLLATDFCDGTLSVVGVDLRGDPTTAELRDRFVFVDLVELVEPLRPDTLGLPRAVGRLAVRPGIPGIDFTGPDVFFTVGLEEGLLCGLPFASP